VVHDVSQLISNHSRYRNYGDGEFRLFAALHYFGWGKMGFALVHLVLFGNQLNGELQQRETGRTATNSEKCALRPPESFEIQLQNLSKDSEPGAGQDQPTPPISTFQNDPKKSRPRPFPRLLGRDHPEGRNLDLF